MRIDVTRPGSIGDTNAPPRLWGRIAAPAGSPANNEAVTFVKADQFCSKTLDLGTHGSINRLSSDKAGAVLDQFFD
jgi:hypothetical protein